MADTLPTQDALIDPGATAAVANVYAQNGPQPPGFAPPKFLTDAVSAMQSYGNGTPGPLGPSGPPPPQAGMYPQGFNPYAAPQDQRGASTDVMGTLGQASSDIHQAVGNLPVLGGLAGFGQDIVNRGPLGTALGVNPVTAGLTPNTPEYRSAVGQSLAAGIVGPESEASQIAGGLKNRIGAGSVAGDIAAEGAGPAQTAAQKSGVQGSDLVQRQLDALKASGATDAQIAEFQKTMSGGDATAARVGQVTTAEGGFADAGDLTRALQTAAGSEGVPLSQHPVFADYGKGGAKVGAKGPVGGDIGTATRAVMANDQDAINLLGDNLANQLIQNKVADIVRRTGAQEDVVRRGLGVMMQRGTAAVKGLDSVADVAPEQVAKLGQTETIGAENIGKVITGLGADPSAVAVKLGLDEIPGAETVAEARQRLADRMGVDATTGLPPTPPSGPTATGGPPGPNFGRQIANTLTDGATFLGHDLPFLATLIGHLPLLRQALPGTISLTLSGHPEQAIQMIGESLRSLTFSEQAMQDATAGFRGILKDNAGMPDQFVKQLISDPHGILGAREDFSLNSSLRNAPVIHNLNQMYPTMQNSLRTKLAVIRTQMAKTSGQPVDWQRIVDQVNHMTGKGDLLFDNTKLGKLFNGALFGPRLLTAPFQQAGDTLIAMKGLAGDIGRRPLDPLDVAQVRDTAGFVASGMLVMQALQNSGMPMNTNSDSRDWGRSTLPDGSRLDLWGPYGPDARLIAQVLTWLNDTQNPLNPNLRPQKYGATSGMDMIEQYLTNKLGPGIPQIAAQALTGRKAGKPYSLGSDVQGMIADPSGQIGSHLPMPIAAEQLGQGDPNTRFQRAGLAELGATVVNTPQKVNYDGLGAAEGTPNYRSGSVLDEFARLAKADPKWHSGDPVMAAPPLTIGRGASDFPVPNSEIPKYMQAFADQRERVLGPLVSSAAYQNASDTLKQTMFDTNMKAADKAARDQYLSTGVVASTDPKQVAAEAVEGFHNQTSEHDKAYWIATLDRAGKLTPAVAAAIESSVVSVTGKKSPITVAEYLRAAPIVHEYLAHVPFGTDTKPYGTPADWLRVEGATAAKNNRENDLVRGGIPPLVARAQALREILATLSPLQGNILRNGTLLENPARRLITQRDATIKTFLGTPTADTQAESQAEYQQFPTGQ